MVIKNVTKNKLISKDVKLVTSLIDKALGLLLKRNLQTLIFKTRFGIHTFFLKKPIDILVLDKNLKVVKIKKNLKPNRLFLWNPKHFWLVELPPNSLNSSQTSLNDIILLI